MALTGLPYEQTRRKKGPLSRLRALGGGWRSSAATSSPPQTSSGTATGGSATGGSATGAGHSAGAMSSPGVSPISTAPSSPFRTGSRYGNDKTDGNSAGSSTYNNSVSFQQRRGGQAARLPSHWLISRTERTTTTDSETLSRQSDVRTNLVVLTVFVLSMISTIFLANVVSLIQ